MSPAVAVPAGQRLFARYAHAPNALGHCGPPDTGGALARVACGGGDDVDVVACARRFSGAWPYQVLIAELAGIADPLDERVVRAYWTGNELTERIDARRFGELLLERFAGQAGHYWSHLTEELLDEVMPTHAFHVFGVYPWSRLLASGRPEPLEVLDGCRIRAAEVLEPGDGDALVRGRSLSWDGHVLTICDAREERVGTRTAHGSFTGPLAAGQIVAVHWGHACDLLEPAEAETLERLTALQIDHTNKRLAAARPGG